MAQALHRPMTADYVLRRKSEAYTILDEICRDLELTEAQFEAAKVSYEAVADWIASSSNPLLQSVSLYAHGSAALGTTVRPLAREDFDVDLICLVLGIATSIAPAELKKLIGDRLREHAVYRDMLEEKKRCWRLNYAREFHLDISPTIPNANCNNGGELVPDKSVKTWKPTNPTGYRLLFEERCKLVPVMRYAKSVGRDEGARANVAPFPEQRAAKGILRRVVQLLKRHRDVFFADIEADVAPISIIITTLAAQAYEYCVRSFVFDTELDVVLGTIRMMPHFIDRPFVGGRRIYVVNNETTEGENFAERWNSEPERAVAFYQWHGTALADFESIAALEGLDVLTDGLSKALGSRVVRKVMDARTETVSTARAAKTLFVAPAVGLTLGGSANATQVPRNTHFGDRPR